MTFADTNQTILENILINEGETLMVKNSTLRFAAGVYDAPYGQKLLSSIIDENKIETEKVGMRVMGLGKIEEITRWKKRQRKFCLLQSCQA